MKLYITLSKKALFCMLCFVLLFVCFASCVFTAMAKTVKNGDTYAKRTDFLKGLGCEIFNDTESRKQITVPLEFSPVYKTYNALNKKAGYDLTRFKGEKCTVYSFSVKSFADLGEQDYPTANIIVYNGRIIGGDISSAKIDGKMYPLKRYEKTKT